MQYGSSPGSPRAGMVVVKLHLFGCRSLKEKRSRMRRIVKDIHDLNFSAAEVGQQDVCERATLACALVGSDWVEVERRLGRIPTMLYRSDLVQVMDSWIERLI